MWDARNHGTEFVKGLLASFAVVLILPALLAGQSSQEQRLTEQFNRYNRAFAARDTDAIVAYYAQNSVRIPPEQAVELGPGATHDVLGPFFEENDFVLDDVQTRGVTVVGELGYVLATFEEHWTPRAGGETVHQSGRWMSIWRLQDDGSWKIVAEMWNRSPGEAEE
jgi:ketosteroid isomerase-like protein